MRYRLGPSIVDTGTQTILRGDRELLLGRTTGALLALLIREWPRIVSREEIQREVWSCAALSESSIPTCVGALRQALGDRSRNGVVQTVRGRGYRLGLPARSLPPRWPALAPPATGLPVVFEARLVERAPSRV